MKGKFPAKNIVTINATLLCGCAHHNALTCIAESEHTTRFNALIMFAHGNENGGCDCPCHRDSHGQPISASEWRQVYEDEQARIARRAQKARRSA